MGGEQFLFNGNRGSILQDEKLAVGLHSSVKVPPAAELCAETWLLPQLKVTKDLKVLGKSAQLYLCNLILVGFIV